MALQCLRSVPAQRSFHVRELCSKKHACLLFKDEFLSQIGHDVCDKTADVMLIDEPGSILASARLASGQKFGAACIREVSNVSKLPGVECTRPGSAPPVC